MHLAADAFLAVLDKKYPSQAAVELLNPPTHWHICITWAQTQAAKPDSPEWLITFLNMSACVARICAVNAEAGSEEPQPFGAAIVQRNTLELVSNSILQAIEVTNCVIIMHCSCMLMLPRTQNTSCILSPTYVDVHRQTRPRNGIHCSRGINPAVHFTVKC